MFISDEKSLISIGTNCIVNHQITQLYEKTKSGIFDNITMIPDALIEILEEYEKTKSFYFLCDPKMFKTVSNYGFPSAKHRYIRGLVYDHETNLNSKPKQFLSKKNHQVNNLLSINGEKIFVWSNLQPNLIMVCDRHNLDIQDFYLTKKRYEKITELINKNFNSECIFIVREKYCDSEILINKNVYAIEIEQNLTVGLENAIIDSPSWTGPPRLFQNII